MLSAGSGLKGQTVTAVKSASFRYSPPDGLSSLFEGFRSMCNDAIRVAVREKPRSRFRLIELAYESLKGYGLHTHYILSACEVAYSVFRNPRRKNVPYIRKPFIKLANQSYRHDHHLLRVPTTPRNYIFIMLQSSVFHAGLVDDPSLERGSVTITSETVSISFAKEVVLYEPAGYTGMDVNERNATVSATDGLSRRFDELGEVVEVKERYKEIRASIAQKTRGDRRVKRLLLAKYGKRERDKTKSRLNRVTSQIVDYAKEHKLGIKIEKLTGIRKLYRKGNGQSRSFRGRMNSWVLGETQRQIDYKARWEGVPVWYVNPRGTSSHCLCGSRVVPLADRKVYCPMCDKTWDRDDLASKNIMACAVPQARPSRGTHGSDDGEPRKQEDAGNPRSGWREGRLFGWQQLESSQNRNPYFPCLRLRFW